MMKKNEVISALKNSLSEIELLELSLEAKDLIWRFDSNKPSILELLERIVESEHALWMDLLPQCLGKRQRRFWMEATKSYFEQLHRFDTNRRIFYQLGTTRQMTLVLLNDINEPDWDRKITKNTVDGWTIRTCVIRFIDYQSRCLEDIRRTLEERFASKYRGAVWS
jgi:hypothetical protein